MILWRSQRSEDVSFDEITCRRLIVRNDEGEISVGLANDAHDRHVAVYDNGGAGQIMSYSKDGNGASIMPKENCPFLLVDKSVCANVGAVVSSRSKHKET